MGKRVARRRKRRKRKRVSQKDRGVFKKQEEERKNEKGKEGNRDRPGWVGPSLFDCSDCSYLENHNELINRTV
jgi:hypothetical protein